jgi:hypothetical protein
VTTGVRSGWIGHCIGSLIIIPSAYKDKTNDGTDVEKDGFLSRINEDLPCKNGHQTRNAGQDGSQGGCQSKGEKKTT